MRLKVVSWNIRKAVGLDWRRDPERVLRVLSGLNPDIVLLQEADRRLAPRYPALPLDMVRAAGWIPIDADPYTPSIGHHGNAILLRPDLKILEVEPIDLPGLEPRGAVLVRLETQGRSLTVGGLHLGLRQADRRKQVTCVIRAATRLGRPALLGGDLNEWRSQPEALGMPPGWRMVAPGPSFHTTSPIFALDRFLVSAGLSVSVGGVLAKSHAARASDHLPIWACIELPRQP